MVRRLKAHNIPAIVLNNYDGVSTEEAKVGNYKRAKGLEFKVVILLRVTVLRLRGRGGRR